MKKLFERTSIKSLMLKNRFVASATFTGLANPDGSVTPRLVDHLVSLAQGGGGLIVTEFVSVAEQGQDHLKLQLGIHRDDLLPGLAEMANAVRCAGGVVVVQIGHAGVHSAPLPPGREPAPGPSAIDIPCKPIGRAMSLDEIRETVDAFREAALRAQKAGFDGVQVHAAHGFLLSQFLSPLYNKREDEYGGCLENRARIVLEVVRGIRQAVGEGYPLLVKMNSSDSTEGGLVPDEAIRVAGMLEKVGVDALELSGGILYRCVSMPCNPKATTYAPVTRGGVYYEEAAKRYKKVIAMPLILVGGIRSLETSRRLVEQGIADYVALGRPLIREPDLVKRWEEGDERDAECISDNACNHWPGVNGKGVHCVHPRGYRRRKGLLRFYSGSTGTVNTKRAVAECLEKALGEGDLDCDLLIFHTTMGHNFPDILSEARRLCPSAEVVGCTCAGVIGREEPNESMRALAVMAIRGPKEGFAVAGIESLVGMDPYEAGKRIAHELKSRNPNIDMVFFQPSFQEILPVDRAIEGMESVLGRDVPICGSLSLDNMKFVTTFQFLNGRIFERGAVAVGFADPALELICQTNHGFTAIGEPLTVTRSDSHRIYELDGKPGWKCLTERLGLSEYANMAQLVVRAMLGEELPLELHEEYGSKYVIRGPGKDELGNLYVYTQCPEGTKLWLVNRDEAAMIAGMGDMMKRISNRIGGRRPVAVFHADCALRGRLLLNQVQKEEIMNQIQYPLTKGENVPWLGMYGGGELTPLGGRNRIHGYTTSLYVLVEREG